MPEEIKPKSVVEVNKSNSDLAKSITGSIDNKETSSTEESVEKKMSELEYKKKVQYEHKIIGAQTEIKALENAIAGDHAVLMIGDTGVGKTYRIGAIAKQKKKNLTRISLNGDVGINELIGKWLVKDGNTYWQDGPLVHGMRNGDWVVLDEINAACPEVLFCLNSLLDDDRSLVLSEKDGELVRPHDEFRIFATMNPSDDYAGTKELNPALLSRFSIVLWIENYTPEIEKRIIMYQSDVNEEEASIIVDVGNVIRKSRKESKTWFICSTRDLVNWARLLKTDGLTLKESFEWAVLNKAPENEKKSLIDNIKSNLETELDWEAKVGSNVKLLDKYRIEKEKLTKEIQMLEKKRSEIGSRIAKEIAEALTKKEEISS